MANPEGTVSILEEYLDARTASENNETKKSSCCFKSSQSYEYIYELIGKTPSDYDGHKKLAAAIFHGTMMLPGIRLAYVFGLKNQQAAAVGIGALPDIPLPYMPSTQAIFFLAPYASRFLSTFINIFVNNNIEIPLLTRLIDYWLSNRQGRKKYDKAYWITYFAGLILGAPIAYAMALVFVQGMVKEDMSIVDTGFMYLDFAIRFFQFLTGFSNLALKSVYVRDIFKEAQGKIDICLTVMACIAALIAIYVGYSELQTVESNNYFPLIWWVQALPPYIRQGFGGMGYFITFGPLILKACSPHGSSEVNKELKKNGFTASQIKLCELLEWAIALVTCLANPFDKLAEIGVKLSIGQFVGLLIQGLATMGINWPSAGKILGNGLIALANLVRKIRRSSTVNQLDINLALAACTLPLAGIFPPLVVIPTVLAVVATSHACRGGDDHNNNQDLRLKV